MADPLCVVVMGVSGSGKSTLARALADHWQVALLEGDDLHPPASVAKMARGEPLTDEDRGPWLAAVGRWIDERRAAGSPSVVTCSALRRSYRDALRAGRPGVRFCHVAVSPETLRARLAQRRGHYMPASLLPSQLATLEPLGPDEPGVTISAEGAPGDVLAEALRALTHWDAPGPLH